MFDDESVDGVLYDPPYSPRQISECYNDFDITLLGMAKLLCVKSQKKYQEY